MLEMDKQTFVATYLQNKKRQSGFLLHAIGAELELWYTRSIAI
jgi:hypothetical protein